MTTNFQDLSPGYELAESPLVCDFLSENPNRSGKLKSVDTRNRTPPELSKLRTPDNVSFDVQNFIQNSNQPSTEEVFFHDILSVDSGSQITRKPSNITSPVGFPTPQSTGFGSDRYVLEAGVKREPAATIESKVSTFAGLGTATYAFAGLPTISNTAVRTADFGGPSPQNLAQRTMEKKSSQKFVDKGSDEYRRRRDMNNISVRKSREKAKQLSEDTEKRVSELEDENDRLRKKT